MSETRSPNTTPSQLTSFLENFDFLDVKRDRKGDKAVQQAIRSLPAQGTSLRADQSEQGSATADSYDAGSEDSDNTTHFTKIWPRKKTARLRMGNSDPYGRGNRLGETTPPLVLSSSPRAPDRSRRQTMGGDYVSPTFEQQTRRTMRAPNPQPPYQQADQQMGGFQVRDDTPVRSHNNGYRHLPPVYFPPYGQQRVHNQHTGFGYGAESPLSGAGSLTVCQKQQQLCGPYQAFGQQGGSYSGAYVRSVPGFGRSRGTQMTTPQPQQMPPPKQYQQYQLPPRPSSPFSGPFNAAHRRDQQFRAQAPQRQPRPTTPEFYTDYQHTMQMGDELAQQAAGADDMDVDREMDLGAEFSPQLPPNRPKQRRVHTPIPSKRCRLDSDSPEEPSFQDGDMGHRRMQKKRK